MNHIQNPGDITLSNADNNIYLQDMSLRSRIYSAADAFSEISSEFTNRDELWSAYIISKGAKSARKLASYPHAIVAAPFAYGSILDHLSASTQITLGLVNTDCRKVRNIVRALSKVESSDIQLDPKVRLCYDKVIRELFGQGTIEDDALLNRVNNLRSSWHQPTVDSDFLYLGTKLSLQFLTSSTKLKLLK